MEQSPEILKKLEAKAERLRNAAFKTKAQPTSPFESLQYSGFQRRMMAGAIDSFVMLLTIIPLSFWLTNFIVTPVDMDIMPLISSLQNVTDKAVQQQMVYAFLVTEGRLYYLFVNSMVQIFEMFIYCMWFSQRYGATPGKMIMRLKLVNLATGAHLSYKESFWRCVGYMVSSLPLGLGFIWMVWDKNRQCWHDKMVGSVVVAGLNFNKNLMQK